MSKDKKSKSNELQVVDNNDVERDNDPVAKLETIKFNATLHNGRTVELEALKNREDYPMELLEHAERGNYVTFLMGTLTVLSKELLKFAGATYADYPTVSAAYGEAVGAITSE